MVQHYGGSVVERLIWDGAKPSLSVARNGLAHGYPFDGFPTGGLLELIRDVID